MTQSNDTFAAGEVLECVQGTVTRSDLVKGACYGCEAFETARSPSGFSSDRVRINGNWWLADRFRRATPHDPPGFAEEPESDAAHWVTTVGGERLVGGRLELHDNGEIEQLRKIAAIARELVEKGRYCTIERCEKYRCAPGEGNKLASALAKLDAIALSPTPEPAREGGA